LEVFVKSFFAMVVLASASISLFAQQSGKTDSDRPQYRPDGRCEDFGYLVDHPSQRVDCDRYNEDYTKKLHSWYEATKTSADDAINAIDDVKKLRSKDVNQQIDGVTGAARDVNNRGNENDASQFVTDKSVSLINQMAHRENEILDNVGKSIEENTKQASPNSESSFSSSGHTLNVGSRDEAGQPSLEQQFQNQASQARTIPASNSSDQNRNSGATLQGVFQNQESDILKSPSTVLAVASADQQRQAALEQERIELARLVRQEAIAEAKLKAEQEKADEHQRREIDQELASRRTERRVAWESARRRWLQAMGALPPDRPSYTPGYYPSLPAAADQTHGGGGSFSAHQGAGSTPCVLVGTIGGGCVHEDAAPYSAQDGRPSGNQPASVSPAAQPASSSTPSTVQ
jgi:hypothetical protein